MSLLRIFVDFNSLDPERQVRLDSVGSKQDIEKLGDSLRERMHVVMHDGDFEAEGILAS